MPIYEPSGRLSAIYVEQARLPADISGTVIAAPLSLSITATSQLELTFSDPALALVAGGFMPKRTGVTYAGLVFEIAVRETVTANSAAGGPVPAFKITARARAVQRLKRRVGPRAWRGLSYTQWLAGEARAVGATLIGQPSAARTQIVRKADKGQPPENSWDVAQRAAGELGFIVFESAGVIYFGRPSWLVGRDRATRHVVKWLGGGGSGTDPNLLAVPNIRDSDDDTAHGLTGTLSARLELAEQLMPGHSLTLTGLGPFSTAPFLIAAANLDLLNPGAANQVDVQTPIDPTPAPASTP